MRLVSAMYEGTYPFDKLDKFESGITTINPDNLQQGDCLIVWGGADISPSLYNKAVGRRTGADDRPSRRDAIEWALMNRAAELDIPIIGVCRGAQMLCALAGGFLIQDVNNHFGNHKATTDEGIEITVNSIHHQMLYPFEVEHEMLAEVKNPLSTHHLDVDTDIPMPTEPEFVYFPKVKGFAIQWHPEGMPWKSDATQFIYKQLDKRL